MITELQTSNTKPGISKKITSIGKFYPVNIFWVFLVLLLNKYFFNHNVLEYCIVLDFEHFILEINEYNRLNKTGDLSSSTDKWERIIYLYHGLVTVMLMMTITALTRFGFL